MRVFNRYEYDPHPYKHALRELQQSADPAERAVSLNIQYDHRVRIEREQSFDKVGKWGTSAAPSKQQFHDAIVNYYNDKVLNRTLPEFVYHRANHENFIPLAHSEPQRMNRDVELARVVDLNGLGKVYQWARKRRIRTFASFPVRWNDASVAVWLNRRLTTGQPILNNRFVCGVLDALKQFSTQRKHQPAWATAWNFIEPYVHDGADRWLEVLGAYKPTAQRWAARRRCPRRGSAMRSPDPKTPASLTPSKLPRYNSNQSTAVPTLGADELD